MNQLLFNEREVCERLRIGRSTLRRLQADGRIRPVYIGRSVRYAGSELSRFVEFLEAEQADAADQAQASNAE